MRAKTRGGLRRTQDEEELLSAAEFILEGLVGRKELSRGEAITALPQGRGRMETKGPGLKANRYTRYQGDPSEPSPEEILSLLEDFLLDSGFSDPFQRYDPDPNRRPSLEDLYDALLQALLKNELAYLTHPQNIGRYLLLKVWRN